MKISSHGHPDTVPVAENAFHAVGRLLYRLHLLNLDVVVGAIASNLMVRHLWQIPAYSLFSYYVLGSSVFIIYAADRLLDTHRTTNVPLTARHRFHDNHRALLWFTVGLLTILSGLVTLVFLPWQVIVFGLGLALFVAVYLLMVHLLGTDGARWFHKEPLVALLYTAGIWGIVMVMKEQLLWTDWGLCLVFMLIAFQNLLLFSLFDWEADVHKRERSLATHWGRETSEWVLQALFGLGMLGLVILWEQAANARQKEVIVVEGMMSLVLFILGLFPGYFKRQERYRWLGDGIFFLPLLTL